MSFEVTLPWPPRELSPNSRTHWARKSVITKSYRDACFILAKEAKLSVDWDGDIHLWIDFYPPDKRHRDDDNLVSSFKAGRDGIAAAIGVNDKRFRTHPWVKSEIGGMVKIKMTKGLEQ